jgi:hypothetical protein
MVATGSVSVTTPNGTATFAGFTYCNSPSITSIIASNNPLCPGSTTGLYANGVTGSNAVVNWYSQPNGAGSSLGTGISIENMNEGTYYARVAACGVMLRLLST